MTRGLTREQSFKLYPWQERKYTMKYCETDGGRSEYYRVTKNGDCVIRSLAIGTGTDYKQVWQELCDMSKQSGFFMNEKPVWSRYLKERGFTEHKLPKPWKSVDRLRLKNAIVYVRSGYGTHLTAVVNGNLHDTWDCRDRLAYSYWTR